MMPVSDEDYYEAMEWQPIETAPKDGSTVMVSSSNEEVCLARCYKISKKRFKWFAFIPVKHPFRPTHWMPLPEPPVSRTESASGDESACPNVSVAGDNVQTIPDLS